MLWEEYYEKLSDWATSTAVSRLSKLESFGPPEEIIDAIITIGFDDEKGATRLLKKATAAGVRFSGDQLSELFLTCSEDELNSAVSFSAEGFTTEDLDALHGFCEDDVLVGIARKHRIPLPESLADFVDNDATEEEDWEENLTSQELAAEYNYILDCLKNAYELLKKAHHFSLVDTSRQKRSATVLKYAHLADAQTQIEEAQNAWNRLDIPNKDPRALENIWPDIGNSTMWTNYLLEGLFTNIMVRRRIQKAMKHISAAYDRVRALRDAVRFG